MTTPDVFYKEAMEHCQSYNSRLMTERRIRLPYLDSQTRVAQNDCCLWFEKRHRGPGLHPNQVYSYASKRWKKRPRFNPLPDTRFEETAHLINENSNDSSNIHAIAAAMMEEEPEIGESNSTILNNEDLEDFDEDFDVRSRRKSKRSHKATTSTGKAKRSDAQDDKTHACEYCGKKYKNRPSLNYHLQHMHQEEMDADDEYTPGGRHTPSSIVSDDVHSTTSRASAASAQKTVTTTVSESGDPEGMETRPKRKRQTPMNDYCDFCLGDADENKKTGVSEELVSCADCGRSGHPTCLQFTDIMTMNVKKYSWQCIECKSCHLCGTSDNDEQLLFCDDCDRGYHMYCLQPRMESPPEGSWICRLCESDRKEREKAAAAGNASTLSL
uniref:ZF(C2H2)-17 zinc finger protein n=1 Tax=Phallusia mammillata TaxID=59560 RepID=A0A6F9DAQ4_9ASCI|nr:ZF(C2H2)-17 zinc finger protein [Phallusia mammillata]